MSLTRSIYNLHLLRNIISIKKYQPLLQWQCISYANRNYKSGSSLFHLQNSSIHTTSSVNEVKGLMEFFDDKENWGADEVKVGRSWKKEELRIKSNVDLHKLWYVLLKEKNMLLTMEEASKKEFKIFPNPERIDKVEDSMSNLEEVIRERNKAYMLLETGEAGERPAGEVVDTFGRTVQRRFAEYKIPDYMNNRYLHRITVLFPQRTHFSRLLREKRHGQEHAAKCRKTRYISKLFQLYHDIDMDALQKKFPDVDVEKIRKYKMSLGNHNNNKC